jgi:hypothetical protein
MRKALNHSPWFDDETQLVLLLSTPRLHDAEVARLRELACRALDWNRVLGMLVLHRTVGLAWSNMLDHNLTESPQFRPASSLTTLRTLFRSQYLYVREQIARNAALINRFDDEGIPCAIMKGSAVASMAYPRLGMRMFSDNDFLFASDHITAVGSILKELGYIQGDWDPTANMVRPATRRQIMLHPVTSHETYPYELPTPDALILESHCVDVHFSLDLMTSNRNDEAVRELLARRVSVAGNDTGRLWALSPEDMFVFLCVHFQREAVNRREAEWVKDLLLYKATDLLAVMDAPQAPLDFTVVAERANILGFEREVFFSLTYVEALYPHRVPNGVAEHFRPPGSIDFLHQVTHNGEPVHTWSTTVAERFFDPKRAAELIDG